MDYQLNRAVKQIYCPGTLLRILVTTHTIDCLGEGLA